VEDGVERTNHSLEWLVDEVEDEDEDEDVGRIRGKWSKTSLRRQHEASGSGVTVWSIALGRPLKIVRGQGVLEMHSLRVRSLEYSLLPGVIIMVGIVERPVVGEKPLPAASRKRLQQPKGCGLVPSPAI
jgi:hypothetical protein